MPKSNDKSYSYDLSNNLLSYNSTYDTITNQLISNDMYECSYDILGNMTQKYNKTTKITTYYRYDDLSRLIEYKQIDNTNSIIKEFYLSYNPLSQRASKYYKDKNESYYHKYIYDKHNIIGIYDARSDELVASFIHTPNTIDKPLSITTTKGIYYYHLDTNNSVIAISNKLGEIVQSFTYDDFGYIIDKYTHINHKELDILNPYTYTSREYDSEELYYYRARYYNPTIKRFITPDPISYLSKDINFYAYVTNNPINLTDPSGLSPKVDMLSSDMLGSIYGNNIANNLPQSPYEDILTPPTSPTNAEPMGKDGFKVKGFKPKLDIGKTLYFVFYTKGGTKNDSIFQDTAKARVKYIKEDTLYCKDTDIVYLLESNKTSQILSLVKEKVAKHGGEEKTIIRSIEVFAELEKQPSEKKETQKKETPPRQQPWWWPQPSIPQGVSIEEARNTINNNVIRQDKIYERNMQAQDKFLEDLKNGTIVGLKWVETLSTVILLTTTGKVSFRVTVFFGIANAVSTVSVHYLEKQHIKDFTVKLTFDTFVDTVVAGDKKLQIANELIIKPYFIYIYDKQKDN